MLRWEKSFARTAWEREKNTLDEQPDEIHFQRRLVIAAVFLTILLLLVWVFAVWRCV